MELLNSLLDNFWFMTAIYAILVVITVVLQVLSVILLEGNTVLKIFGGISASILVILAVVTKIFGIAWSMLAILKIIFLCL